MTLHAGHVSGLVQLMQRGSDTGPGRVAVRPLANYLCLNFGRLAHSPVGALALREAALHAERPYLEHAVAHATHEVRRRWPFSPVPPVSSPTLTHPLSPLHLPPPLQLSLLLRRGTTAMASLLRCPRRECDPLRQLAAQQCQWWLAQEPAAALVVAASEQWTPAQVAEAVHRLGSDPVRHLHPHLAPDSLHCSHALCCSSPPEPLTAGGAGDQHALFSSLPGHARPVHVASLRA